MKKLLCISTLIAFLSCSRSEQLHPDDLFLYWDLPEGVQLKSATHIGEFTLVNRSQVPLDSSWTIYFNSIFIPPGVEMMTDEVRIEHLSGDFLKMAPSDSYQSIQPGDSLKIRYKAKSAMIKNSHAPSGLYVVLNEKSSKGQPLNHYFPSKITLAQMASAAEGTPFPIPTPQYLYEANRSSSLLSPKDIAPFLPSPKQWEWGEGVLELTSPLIIAYDQDFKNEAVYIGKKLKELFKGDIYFMDNPNSPKANIKLQKTDEIDEKEAYTLKANQDEGLSIIAKEGKGLFYGIQSLFALLPSEVFKSPAEVLEVPEIEIEDAPSFAYRGLFLDVARNFQQKASILKLLDLMAFYKLNVFHLNLANDEAWRIEIPGLPELIHVGSRRGHAQTETEHLYPYYGSGPGTESLHGSGFLFRADLIEILQYAQERHIEVIPEIGGPGHSRAAIHAMRHRFHDKMGKQDEEGAKEFLLEDFEDASTYLSAQNFRGNTLNVCQESTYRFYEKVIDEIISMYRDAKVPINTFHTGGDEVPRGVWKGSPACHQFISEREEISDMDDLNNYFLARMQKILRDRGIQMAGWEEIGQVHQKVNEEEKVIPNPAFADAGFRVYAWNSVPGWGGEDMAYQLANAGYEVIVCNSSNIYFDLAYDMDPDEPGHVWSGFVDLKQSWRTVPLNHFLSNERDMYGNPLDPDELAKNKVKLSETGKKNIKGIQGQLWTETVKGEHAMEYYLLPKMLGLAERAWSGDADWADMKDVNLREKALKEAWNHFANVVGQMELPRLQWLNGGYFFRIPKPGAMIKDGMLYANVETPGLEIRYTTDGKSPGPQSQLYTGPVEVTREVRLKAFVPNGRSGGEVLVFPKNQLPLK